MFYVQYVKKNTSDLLIPSFLMSDVSESLKSFTKNERRSESLICLSKSLIRSFFRKETSNLLKKYTSKFPALNFICYVCILKHKIIANKADAWFSH